MYSLGWSEDVSGLHTARRMKKRCIYGERAVAPVHTAAERLSAMIVALAPAQAAEFEEYVCFEMNRLGRQLSLREAELALELVVRTS